MGWPFNGYTDTEDVWLSAFGYKGQTFPLTNASNVMTTSSQLLIGVAIPLRAGSLITNIGQVLSSAGTGNTLCKYGIYSSAGSLLASTASWHGSIPASGPNTVALSAPYTITATGIYYFAYLVVTSTTAPAVAGATLGNGAYSLAPSSVRWTWQQSGQADLPATATITASSTANPWFFWS